MDSGFTVFFALFFNLCAVLQVLSFLEETQVALNTIHCNVVLAAHARSKKWFAALQLLNRLPQMKIQADVALQSGRALGSAGFSANVQVNEQRTKQKELGVDPTNTKSMNR